MNNALPTTMPTFIVPAGRTMTIAHSKPIARARTKRVPLNWPVITFCLLLFSGWAVSAWVWSAVPVEQEQPATLQHAFHVPATRIVP